MPTTLVRALTRTSQIRTLASALHDANTVRSVGDHCRSSTEDVWDVNGEAFVVNPLGVEVVRKILLAMSPVRRRRLDDVEYPTLPPQSIAKPS